MYDLAAFKKEEYRSYEDRYMIRVDDHLYKLHIEVIEEFHRARKDRNPSTNPHLVSSEPISNIYIGSHGVLGYIERSIFKPNKGLKEKEPRRVIMFPILIPKTLWDEMAFGESVEDIRVRKGLQQEIPLEGYTVDKINETHPISKIPLFDQEYVISFCAEACRFEEEGNVEKMIRGGEALVKGKLLEIEGLLHQKACFENLYRKIYR